MVYAIGFIAIISIGGFIASKLIKPSKEQEDHMIELFGEKH